MKTSFGVIGVIGQFLMLFSYASGNFDGAVICGIAGLACLLFYRTEK